MYVVKKEKAQLIFLLGHLSIRFGNFSLKLLTMIFQENHILSKRPELASWGNSKVPSHHHSRTLHFAFFPVLKMRHFNICRQMEGLSRGGAVRNIRVCFITFRVATADALCSLGKLESQIISGNCTMQKRRRIRHTEAARSNYDEIINDEQVKRKSIKQTGTPALSKIPSHFKS